jgi:hypothetical protein
MLHSMLTLTINNSLSFNKFTSDCVIDFLNKLRGLSPRSIYTDRATAVVGEVSANVCG